MYKICFYSLTLEHQFNSKEEKKINIEEVENIDLERTEYDMEWKDNDSSDDNSGTWCSHKILHIVYIQLWVI